MDCMWNPSVCGLASFLILDCQFLIWNFTSLHTISVEKTAFSNIPLPLIFSLISVQLEFLNLVCIIWVCEKASLYGTDNILFEHFRYI